MELGDVAPTPSRRLDGVVDGGKDGNRMADSKIEPRSERRIPVRGFLEGQIEEMDLEPYRRTTFGLDVGGADYENGSVVLLCVWALGRNEPDQGGYMMELSLTEQDVDDLIAQLQNRKSWFHRPTHTG